MKKTARRRGAPKPHMYSRTQGLVNLAYFWRRASIEQTIDFHGFIGPVGHDVRMKVLELAQTAPQHWQVAVIAYCRDSRGDLYRDMAETRSEGRLAAWLPRTDAFGKFVRDEQGEVQYIDQLTGQIAETLAKATSGTNPNHVYDHAVIMRPWSKRTPSMIPVLRRIQKELELQDHEINEWDDE